MSPQPATAACVWCGLPLPKSWWHTGTAPAADDAYCCFGCRFAAQVSADRGEAGKVRWTLTRLGIAIFFAMNVSMFTMALWSYDVYEVAPTDTLAATITDLLVWLSLLASLPVLFLLGVPIAVSGCLSLRDGRITSDLLVIAGVFAAFAYSVVSVLNGSSHIYFEVASLVLVLVTLGRWLEAHGKLQTNEVLESLERLLPPTARRIEADSTHLEVPTSSLIPTDRVRVLAGERIPADGRVVNQAVSVDEQLLTGESLPVLKQPGDAVASGTLNLDGDLIIEVTRPVDDSTIARLVKVVREARQSLGHYQRLADKVTTGFVPFVAVVCAIAIGWHLTVATVAESIMAGLAVVLIACPCALGLATSVAVWTALGRAAERGVLIRNGEVLEKLARVQAVRFDKTGTLTTGEARVTALLCSPGTEAVEVVSVARQLAQRSTHVFSRAISTFDVALNEAGNAASQDGGTGGDAVIELLSLQSIVGRGMRAIRADGRKLVLGSREFLRTEELEFGAEFERSLQAALTSDAGMVFVGWNGAARGVFLLSESVRSEVAEMLQSLNRSGLDLRVLSGDRPERVARFVTEAAGDSSSLAFEAGLLPEQKLAALRHAKNEFGAVMMVGDGINDAPALAAADVGVALGCGTDVSRDAAGVCLLSNDLTAIPWVIELGRLTRRVILQNLAWAFGYNAIGMTLAAFGLLSPVVAAIVMFVSSLVVLANSRRLHGFDRCEHSIEPVTETLIVRRTAVMAEAGN